MNKLTNNYILTEEIREENGNKWKSSYYKWGLLIGAGATDHPYWFYKRYKKAKKKMEKLDKKLKDAPKDTKFQRGLRNILQARAITARLDVRKAEAKFREAERRWKKYIERKKDENN